MKAESQLNMVIGVMIALIIGIVGVMTVVSSFVTTATNSQGAQYQAITCTNGSTASLSGYVADSTTLSIVTNGTVHATLPAVDYTLIAGGYGQLSKVKFDMNASETQRFAAPCAANYTYFDITYAPSSANRTLIALYPIFIGIGLLMLVIFLIGRHGF